MMRYKVNTGSHNLRDVRALVIDEASYVPRDVAMHINKYGAVWQAENQYAFLVCDLTPTPSRW